MSMFTLFFFKASLTLKWSKGISFDDLLSGKVRSVKRSCALKSAPPLPPHCGYLQSLGVAGDVPGHAAEPLAVTVHCSPGTGALGRTGLAGYSAQRDQNQEGDQQPERSGRGASRASGAQSCHHHCGKCGANVRPTQNTEEILRCFGKN